MTFCILFSNENQLCKTVIIWLVGWLDWSILKRGLNSDWVYVDIFYCCEVLEHSFTSIFYNKINSVNSCYSNSLSIDISYNGLQIKIIIYLVTLPKIDVLWGCKCSFYLGCKTASSLNNHTWTYVVTNTHFQLMNCILI